MTRREWELLTCSQVPMIHGLWLHGFWMLRILLSTHQDPNSTELFWKHQKYSFTLHFLSVALVLPCQFESISSWSPWCERETTPDFLCISSICDAPKGKTKYATRYMCCSRPVSDLFRVSSDTVNWHLQVAGTVYRSAAVPQSVLVRMLEGRTFFPTKSDWKWIRCGRNGGSNRIGDHEVSTFLWSNESAKIPDNTLHLVELLVNQYVPNYWETHMFVCAYIFCEDSKIWCLFNLKMCTNIYVPIDLQAHFLIFRSEDRWRNVQVVQQCCYESGFQKLCHSGDVRWRWFQGFRGWNSWNCENLWSFLDFLLRVLPEWKGHLCPTFQRFWILLIVSM